ncbi:MAG: TIGR02221 family CRISPR-associated protein [Spirochaetaceae bacterium]|nr:TIGR02221 family CRISPR-associated protein [Spirochaetaceae bacterium]
MPTVLISFLGTSRYDCVDYRYSTNENDTINTKYAQIAVIMASREYWKDTGLKLLIFVTPEARERNLDELATELERLKADNNYPIDYTSINIQSVQNEQSLWNLFETVFKAIPQDSDIIFDITHAFRSIPVLGLAIINYAKTVKNCHPKGIYYASFDQSLPQPHPVIDLTRIDDLQRWSIAVAEYLHSGNSKEILLLSQEVAKRYYTSKRQPDFTLNKQKNLAEKLNEIWPVLATNRSKEIIDGSLFKDIQKILGELNQENASHIKPMTALYDKIYDSLRLFKPDALSNLLVAVFLCIQYNMIQQGITILEESIITLILNEIGADYIEEKNRNMVSWFMNYCEKKEGNTHPRNEPDRFDSYLAQILDDCMLATSIASTFNKIRDLRNDINHAEFRKQSMKPRTIIENFRQYFKEALDILSSIDTLKDNSIKETSSEIKTLMK